MIFLGVLFYVLLGAIYTLISLDGREIEKVDVITMFLVMFIMGGIALVKGLIYLINSISEYELENA